MTHRTRLLAPLLALSLLATVAACSGDEPAEGRGVDARSYYEDYDVDAGGDRAFSAGAPNAAMFEAATDHEGPALPQLPPGPNEDNTFTDHGVADFTDANKDAESTFALDVDTGSFGVARQFVTSGFPVEPDSIRLEEWVNALPYSDSAPQDGALGVVTESGLAPTLDDGTQLVRVGVSARVVDPASRPRANITLVVDTSGSMDIRERLGLVRASLALLADRLDDDDTVSVVTFENDAVLLLPPTKVKNTDTILDTVEDLKPGGGTNLEAGVRLGYDQARKAFDPDAVNLVVLCSDGVANIGDTGPGSLVEKIQQEGAEGINLVTVGYGLGNYNDTLMEQLANLGDGFYAYVDTFEEADQLFGTDLTTTVVPVASEARAQVVFDPAVVKSYRLLGYENREIADDEFEDLSVDAGELGSGHHATALYEVVLADGVEPGTVIGEAKLAWKDADSGAAATATADVVAHDEAAPASTDLELAAAAADLAQVLKGQGPLQQRRVSLADVRDRIDALVAAEVAGAEELAELAEGAAAIGN